MVADAIEVPLRIVVTDPVSGVALALQRGKTGSDTLIAPSRVAADAISFDLTVSASPAQSGPAPRLLGPFVQGPTDGRFVYLCVGQYAGDPASPWARRAKIPLTGLTWPLIEAIQAGGCLEARIAGRGKDGSPACASVKLLPPGWQMA
jgi:hypothetical protein